MSSAAIQLGLALAELASTGLDLAQVIRTASESGKVPKEQWDRILQEIDRANKLWTSR